jgi:arylformamidase
MRIEDYPAQEPLSAFALPYHETILKLSEAAIAASEEVSYGPDPYQGILIQRAAKPNGALLVFMHGGGWTSGYKEWMAFMGPPLTAQGITFASIGYRLAPDHVFPVGLEDAMAAFAWLHARAADYGARPDRMFLGGHSAGGHYAALLGVRKDWQKRHGLPDDVIRGCLPLSGVYDFGPGSGMSMRPRFLGPDPTEIAASPIANIQGPPPPFLIEHGDQDFPHLMKQAERMEEALRAVGGNVERLVLPGTHFTSNTAAADPNGAWVTKAVALMS